MEYQPGAVLCNLFLADELNRATSRTQAALLEAMEEGQVTVDGVTHALPRPFIVIATQNPAGASGTQLLPDSQLDRFMVKLSLGYPEPQDELRMLRRKQKGNPLDGVQQALDKAGLAALRAQTDQVYVSDEVLDYIVRLVGGEKALPGPRAWREQGPCRNWYRGRARAPHWLWPLWQRPRRLPGARIMSHLRMCGASFTVRWHTG